MQNNFDKKTDRRGTLSVKWNRKAIKSIAADEEAEPFWVADMDFTVAHQIAEEAVKTAEAGIYGYPHVEDKQAVFCSWAKKRHNWEVESKQVIISPGMLTSISLLTEILTSEGDGVIVPFPAYQPFMRIVRNHNRNLLTWPLLYDEHTQQFSLDWDAFEVLCEQAKLLIFCSPHNPSGIAFSEEELTRLSVTAKNHGVAIVCDEIHADLSFGKHHPLLPLASAVGCTAVTCMAPSKTFNIAGEHYSVTVFEDDSLKKTFLKRLEQLFLTETSFFSTTVALAAYEHGYQWLMDLLVYLQGNVELIDQYCNLYIPQIKLVKPKASFITFLDCKELLPLIEKDAQDNPELYDPKNSPSGGLLSRFFGIRAQVALNDGTWFGGEAYRQFVRFNYGTQREAVESALKRMDQAVQFLFETYAT